MTSCAFAAGRQPVNIVAVHESVEPNRKTNSSAEKSADSAGLIIFINADQIL